MTFVLPFLYHWTPADRHEKIARGGLRVYSKPTVQSGQLRWPYISLGFTPSGAWGLSGDFINGLQVNQEDPIEEWDLWQVNLPSDVHVEVRGEMSDKLQEVKIYTSIPANHLWYVATRDHPPAARD